MASKLRDRDTTLPRTRYAISTAVGNAIPCHHTINSLDTTGTTYTFYEMEKRKETIKEKTKTNKTNRKMKTNKLNIK